MQLSKDLKAIIVSSLPLVISIILFFAVGNFGISKITDVRNQISQRESDQAILSQKVSLLTSVTATAASLSSSAVVALPDSNTTLAVFSQLKNLATLNSLVLSNLKAGSAIQDPSGLSRVDVSFDASGSVSQLSDFLKNIANLAPIMGVNIIKISESGGTTKATVTVASFWSPLPKTIPPETQAVSDLSPDEKTTLAQVKSLIPPSIGIAPSTETSGKANPFQ